jgi:hypothetical protein
MLDATNEVVGGIKNMLTLAELYAATSEIPRIVPLQKPSSENLKTSLKRSYHDFTHYRLHFPPPAREND